MERAAHHPNAAEKLIISWLHARDILVKKIDFKCF